MYSGLRLEDFIKAAKYKKKDFAAYLEIEPSHLSRHVGLDGTLPRQELLEKIAALGCNIHWLLTGDGEMYTDKTLKERAVTDAEIAALESLLSKLKSKPL